MLNTRRCLLNARTGRRSCSCVGRLSVSSADPFSRGNPETVAWRAQRTAELTAAAVSAGQVIVSGLALGIDGIAHQAALQIGGASIAVLPCGIDRVYPRRHTVLAERLIKVGAVVSEFPWGRPRGNITFIDAIARCRVSVCRRWSWRRADPVAHCLPHTQRLTRVVMSSRCRGLSTTSGVEQAVVIYYRTAPP